MCNYLLMSNASGSHYSSSTDGKPAAELPDGLVALLRGTSTCYIATVMPDGSPQLTQTWADTDGSFVVVNTVVGTQKDRNIARDARVALAIFDPTNPSRYFGVRGRVVSAITNGGAQHIESLARRYLGGPYPWHGGRNQMRLVLRIAADRINSPWG